MKTFTVCTRVEGYLNGVRIGRVERFFIGDAIEDGPVPVQVEINRKLVLRHMVEQKNEIFDEDGNSKRIDTPLNGAIDSGEFVTVSCVNLTTENDPGDDPETPNKLYGSWRFEPRTLFLPN